MNKAGRDTVQAVPLIEDKINLGAGEYLVTNLIHCEVDATITFPDFKDPAFTYVMIAGEDRAFSGRIVVVSGTVTID